MSYLSSMGVELNMGYGGDLRYSLREGIPGLLRGSIDTESFGSIV
jgi:hypothetical protein